MPDMITYISSLEKMINEIISFKSGLSKSKKNKCYKLARYLKQVITCYRELSEILQSPDSFDMGKYYEVTQELLFHQKKIDDAVSEALGKVGINEVKRLQQGSLWQETIIGMGYIPLMEEKYRMAMVLQIAEAIGLLEASRKILLTVC